jgi:hypothetical protein
VPRPKHRHVVDIWYLFYSKTFIVVLSNMITKVRIYAHWNYFLIPMNNLFIDTGIEYLRIKPRKITIKSSGLIMKK